MVASGGISILSLFLLFGGGASLPLGMPPLPQDPIISRAAPAKCLAYFSWSGMAAPDAKSANHTEQLLGEPEVQKMIVAIDGAITAAMKKDVQRGHNDAETALDAYRLAKTALTHGGAIFVEAVEFAAARPHVQGGAIFSLGDKAAEVAETFDRNEKLAPPGMVEKTTIDGTPVRRFKISSEIEVQLAFRDGYFIIGMGKDSLVGIFSRLKGEPPAWLTAIHKQLPVARVATVTYIDVKQALGEFLPLGPPQAKNWLDLLGVGNVQSFASVTGLDDSAFVSRTLVRLDGEPEGILRLAATKPLTAADLAPIPRDATIAFAGRLDAAAAMDLIVNKVGSIEPNARKDFVQNLGKLNEHLGVDIEDDLLKSLGDVWCVYNSPCEGGVIVTGLTGVVQVKDHDRLEAAMNKLIMTFHDQVEVPAAQGDSNNYYRRAPRIAKTAFAGRTIYYFDIPLRDFPPIAPAWCLTDKELVVATFPQHIKAYLSRPKDQPSIADAPDVAGALKDGGAVALGYCDTRKLAEYLYPFACIGGQAVADEMRRGGPEFDVSALIPSAAAILPHLQPSVSLIRRTSDGIEIVRHGPIGGPAAMNLFVALGVFGYRKQAAIYEEPREMPAIREDDSAPAIPHESMVEPKTIDELTPARDLKEPSLERLEVIRDDNIRAAKKLDEAQIAVPESTRETSGKIEKRPQPRSLIERKAKEIRNAEKSPSNP